MKLYLRTTELVRPYAPRLCKILKRLGTELRDDLALVELTPALPAETYTTANELTELVIASRFKGESLFNVKTTACVAVYICLVPSTADMSQSSIDSRALAILDWGEVRFEAD